MSSQCTMINCIMSRLNYINKRIDKLETVVNSLDNDYSWFIETATSSSGPNISGPFKVSN